MRPIGSFGGGAGAASINDAGQVVGNFSTGGDFPWIWTRGDGVRFLQDLVDAPDYKLLSAKRINEAGQILVRVTHLPTFTQQPGLLLPAQPEGEARVGFMSNGEVMTWEAVPGAAGMRCTLPSAVSRARLSAHAPNDREPRAVCPGLTGRSCPNRRPFAPCPP